MLKMTAILFCSMEIDSTALHNSSSDKAKFLKNFQISFVWSINWRSGLSRAMNIVKRFGTGAGANLSADEITDAIADDAIGISGDGVSNKVSSPAGVLGDGVLPTGLPGGDHGDAILVFENF